MKTFKQKIISKQKIRTFHSKNVKTSSFTIVGTFFPADFLLNPDTSIIWILKLVFRFQWNHVLQWNMVLLSFLQPVLAAR